MLGMMGISAPHWETMVYELGGIYPCTDNWNGTPNWTALWVYESGVYIIWNPTLQMDMAQNHNFWEW